MGLDGVELIMEIEKAFEISIPDPEAEKIRTVGDLHNSVWNHLKDQHSNRCNSQMLFYKLRIYFTSTYGLERNYFRSDTKLNDILPYENRRELYLDFASNIHLKLPGLTLTKPWDDLLSFVGFTTVLGGLLYAMIVTVFFNYSTWFLLVPIAGIMITGMLSFF